MTAKLNMIIPRTSSHLILIGSSSRSQLLFLEKKLVNRYRGFIYGHILIQHNKKIKYGNIFDTFAFKQFYGYGQGHICCF